MLRTERCPICGCPRVGCVTTRLTNPHAMARPANLPRPKVSVRIIGRSGAQERAPMTRSGRRARVDRDLAEQGRYNGAQMSEEKP